MFRTLNSKKRGLTLVEIAIVLIIFGLITSLSIPITVALSRRNKILQAQNDLKTIREAILTFFAINGYLPPPDPGRRVPVSLLHLPERYQFDPITGKPYLYVADEGDPIDTIKIDNIPMGMVSAVLISAGPNGTFDQQDTLNLRFASIGSGGYDDILFYLCELDLKGLFVRQIQASSNICETHNLTVINRGTATVYLRYLYPGFTSNATTISPNTTITLGGIPRFATVQISTASLFNETRSTIAFNTTSFNEGGCDIVITIFYAVHQRAIYITQDMAR